MKGRKIFTKREANEIILLIEEKLKASTTKQKGIRAKIRKRGFFASDFGFGGGYDVSDFLSVVTITGSTTEIKEKVSNKNTAMPSEYGKPKKRSQSDESYVIDLCDEVLKTTALRQHKFDFLRGDPGKGGRQGVKLPVDAYYEALQLVIEFRERQHTEEVKHFDKPDVMTVSGVHRGEQRKIYDQRRRDILPKQGINLIEISYDDFEFDRQKKIVRNRIEDIKVIQSALSKYFRKV